MSDTKDQIERNKKLIHLYTESIRSEGSKLLKVLPQGPGSGLNADLLDGQHAEDIISKAGKLGGKRGHGGAVLGVGGDMLKANYDPDGDFAVNSADNADTVDHIHAADIDAHTVDGIHAAALEKTANKGAVSGYAPLDAGQLVPLANIPATLTGKDADTVDGSHGVALEKVVNRAAASGYCDLDGSVLVPLARLPATLTGKDADTVDGVHAAGFLAGTWASGTCTVANGGTAAHGLGGTPTRVLMSVNALQPYAYSWTADATNITFHHSAAATLIINWLARL